MYYRKERYTASEPPLPDTDEGPETAAASNPVTGAVPGYWEDMTEKFRPLPFFDQLKTNPEYGIQRYPMACNPPDMALPNIEGNFFYRRSFWREGKGGAAVIHFEGVQNAVSVWLNRVFLGRHEGYSAPFDMEIPDGVLRSGENRIILSVSNHRLAGYAGKPVSGLTSRAANECTGGITGDVELREYVCPLRDLAVLVSEDGSEAEVRVELTEPVPCEWSVADGEKVLKKGKCCGSFRFDTAGLSYWSPESPRLYKLTVACAGGAAERIFGIRRLTADGTGLRLNHVPYYLRGICEHCYYPETVHPNHDPGYYRRVVRTVKRLGFNFIRFHTHIPAEEYMAVCDEEGMLLHVECPNNTTVGEWKEIVAFCRRHTSVVIYCCGNELLIDEPRIRYLSRCADVVHQETDALFSPMSALRGVEYYWNEPEQEKELCEKPFRHHPRRIEALGRFSDLYSSYANGQHSYFSLEGDPAVVDAWSSVYGRPRVSHEICIDGTYTDLSLKDRYRNLRIGRTELFSSIESHLRETGMLKKAPLYFRNSCEWQRRVRKFCFETVRRSRYIAGYDFLGPIDTHWHTFGYDVGMMNEFYELKPGETVRNVRMYNSDVVLLTDLGRKTNFASGERISFGLYVSNYGREPLNGALLTVRLSLDGETVECRRTETAKAPCGSVSRLYDFTCVLPEVKHPGAMKLHALLEGAEVSAENEWELYLFPACGGAKKTRGPVILHEMTGEELERLMTEGKDVVLLGTKPFADLPVTFRIGLAGRTSGNLATVIHDHPLMKEMPHEGFCGWQFGGLMEGGRAVCFASDRIPFHPVIEVVSTHKYVIRQAILFEFRAINGRLLVCGFHFSEEDPAARWFLGHLLAYVQSDRFRPEDTLDPAGLRLLLDGKVQEAAANTNFAANGNDRTA